MKDLISIQSKKLLIPTKSAKALADELGANMKTTKTKATRSGRSTIIASTTTTTISSTPNDEKAAGEAFPKPTKKLVRTKAIKSAKDLPKVHSTRLTSHALKKENLSTAANKKRTNAKTNNISKLPASAAISKAKSRKKQGHTKAKVVNIEALANAVNKDKFEKFKSNTQAAISVEPRKTRKRQLTTEAHTEAAATKSSPSTTNAATSRARKSSRLSSFKQPTAVNQKQFSAIPWRMQRQDSTTSIPCFSPPLTRSRLKSLETQGKTTLLTVTDIKKRRF